MGGNPNRLLVVDDEPTICELVAAAAEEIGFEVVAAYSAEQFMDAYAGFQPTLILLDLNMPGTDGVTHLKFLAENGCQARVLLLSGVDNRTLASAERIGRDQGLNMLGNLQKPVRIATLMDIFEQVYEVHHPITEKDLERAIDENQLTVHYQPKIQIGAENCGQCIGVEALVRWRHPNDGLLYPDRFIPLAEQSGLIIPMTEFVLTETLRQLKNWRNEGLELTAAVNLSASMLTDPQLPDNLLALLERHQVPNDQLTIELTESGAMADVASSMATLTRFRIKGVELSIDDFGTGYSSLVQLYRMPFSELKVDKSFVMECDCNTEARAIVEVLVTLGHKLGLKVCAEGVESADTWNYLQGLGCDTAQGYFMSKPIPASQIPGYVREWSLKNAS